VPEPAGALCQPDVELLLPLSRKDFVAQINEVLAKVLAFNLTMVIHEMYEFGLEQEFGSSVTER
jgi:hypothetical protein